MIDTVSGRREPAWVSVQRGLCRRCFSSVARALASLAVDWELLTVAVESVSGGASEHVSGTPEPAIPLNAAVLALRSALSEWAEAAVGMLADTLAIDVAARHKAKGWPVRDHRPVHQAATVLPANIGRLLVCARQAVSVWNAAGTCWHTEYLDGVDVSLKLLHIHWQIAAVLGEANPRRRLALPCPSLDCGAMTLGINNGETDVTCTTCGGRWTEREYNWLAGMLIADIHDREETDMWSWLLAEKTWEAEVGRWLVAERDWRLHQISRLASLTPAELEKIDGWAVVEMLREIVGLPTILDDLKRAQKNPQA